MASYVTVKSVILKAKQALNNDIFYNPVSKSGSYSKQRKIQEGSEEEHLITVLKEKTSYQTATHLFSNLFVKPLQGKIFISGVKCLYKTTIQRTNHIKHCSHQSWPGSQEMIASSGSVQDLSIACSTW